MTTLVDENSCVPRPNVRRSRLDRMTMNLSPAFFSLNMGTGIASILLYNFPYPAGWLRDIGIGIFALNVVLLVLLMAGNVVRYIRWKGLFKATLLHPAASMSWGTFPMGLTTIINMIAYACVRQWGIHWARLSVGLWWLDTILSVFINLGMLFTMITRQTHTIESMSSAWLLPIVTSVVAAATGGVVAEAIAPMMPREARSIIIASYAVWGTGVPLALCIITIYLHRIIIHGIPCPQQLPSLFLPLGPCGQGSFGIMILGKMVKKLATDHGIGIAISGDIYVLAEAIYAGGIITGLILWGLAFCWYTLATAIILDHICYKDRAFLNYQSFNISFTALTFPIGVWATATHTLATELDSAFFRVIAAIVAVQVVIHWIYVMLLTIYKAYDGTIFAAQELTEFPGSIPPRRSSKCTQDEV
ncbi:uncharacterized protein I303_101183 [Kwoniella dejecticola CBS 10117]|uniref:Sulfite efflux pump SSU1 n=1 Tax=Kwoniella dejecticola CBS 10117 TaxID=1296121 RepID=A0A1A6AH79_9TREE|nr:uncharacterized protein I303_01190 [Kwoniella dejecticola CBS 10117]OBR89363.1 hypothetical protein I303_01190 [Kwoniella dejecticola CBS 10117]